MKSLIYSLKALCFILAFLYSISIFIPYHAEPHGVLIKQCYFSKVTYTLLILPTPPPPGLRFDWEIEAREVQVRIVIVILIRIRLRINFVFTDFMM